MFPCFKSKIHKIKGDITIRVYAPSKFKQTILIIPPTGGENILDIWLALYLCLKGARTIIVRRWPNDEEPMTQIDLKRHDRLNMRAVEAIKTVIDWTNCETAGIVGASLGGIYASYATSMDARINKTVIIAAGGPISDVVANGDENIINQLRRSRFKVMGFKNNYEYQQALEVALEWDLVKLANPLFKDRMAFIIADIDKTVLSKYQHKLYKAWGSPSALKILKANHVFGIIRAYTFNANWIAKQFSL